ncbi:MAG: heme-binding protein, partial [Phycisphaerales bacterium]|nr:heme-binding protein [Phycisphaerales bacterium]
SSAPHRATFDNALDDSDLQVVHAALVGLRDRLDDAAPVSRRVIALARGADRLLRQTAIQLLASRLPYAEVQNLCESGDAADRLVGILVAGQRLTVPPLTGPLPDDWPVTPMKNAVPYVGETVEFISGNFTIADSWAKRSRSTDEEKLFALLERRLDDAAQDNAKQAAFFLRLLNDPRTDARCTVILGLPAETIAKAKPLKGATSTGITELPEVFKAVDWPKEVIHGDPVAGAKLFTDRGCAACHASKSGDVGGGGPSLIGAGTRFTVPYLVESVITPNKTVSPIFKWTMVTKKDGDDVAGLITSETGAELELLLPSAIRETIKKSDIAKRELQDRSPMPEGLIVNPTELRDLLAYLATLKEDK